MNTLYRFEVYHQNKSSYKEIYYMYSYCHQQACSIVNYLLASQNLLDTNLFETVIKFKSGQK